MTRATALLRSVQCVALLGLLTALAFGPEASAQEDPDADGFPGISSNGDATEPAIPGPAGFLLIDRSHGETVEFSGKFNLITMLESAGWIVDENTDAPITPQLLHSYTVLLIPTSLFGGILPFSDEEVAAIVSFVESGQGLWAFNEYSTNPIGVNTVANAFGVTFYFDRIEDPDASPPFWPQISNITPHPITSGIKSYTYFAGSCLSASPPATVLATADENAHSAYCPAGSFPPALAVVENANGGCAVFEGDITPLIGQHDPPELLLMLNIVECLNSEGPIAVDQEGWGSVKARYR